MPWHRVVTDCPRSAQRTQHRPHRPDCTVLPDTANRNRGVQSLREDRPRVECAVGLSADRPLDLADERLGVGG